MERLAASARALVEASRHGPALSDLPLERAREAVAAMAVQFGAGDPIDSATDVAIPAEYDLPLRLYRPLAQQDLPPLLWLHGGGWSTGDLDTSDALCRRLSARTGAVVASLDYRLAPEHPFPAALDDVDVAARWLGDPTNGLADERGICVGGDSAGGNLAAAWAMNDPSFTVAAQLLLFPAADLRGGYRSEMAFGEGIFTTSAELRTWTAHYLAGQEPDDPRVSPVLAAAADAPPTIVITAECDPLRDSGEKLAEVLRGHGVPVRTHRFDGMVHDFVLFGDLIPEADAATDLIAGEFNDLLGESAT